MVGVSRWTTEELAGWLGCDRRSTSRRVESLTETAAATLLADLTALVPSGRADRAAAKALAFVRTAGLLALADPEGLLSLFRELAERQTIQTQESRKER